MAVMTIGTWSPRTDCFDFNLKCLLYVGLWPDENWSDLQKKLYKSYQVLLLILAFIFMVITAIGLYFAKEDYIIFLTNMDKTIVAYNYVLKIIMFLIKRNEIKALVLEIVYSGDRISEERKRLMVFHVIIVSGMIMTLIGVFQFLAHIKGEMLVDAWFPFDPRKNKWTLFLAGQILGLLFLVPCVLRAIFIQGLVCSIIMYLCDQLADLQGRLKKLIYSEEEEANIREEFKCIIKKHIRLMGYAKSLSQAFQEYFLIQNMAVTAELCLNALMVSFVGLEQKKHLITFMTYLMVALFNAYIFCYLGNELMDQYFVSALVAGDGHPKQVAMICSMWRPLTSPNTDLACRCGFTPQTMAHLIDCSGCPDTCTREDFMLAADNASAGIAMAAYESSWISWPVDMQKDLLLIITVTQRSFKLSAGGMAYMSMETFAVALYNGYSMFAVLRDVVN